MPGSRQKTTSLEAKCNRSIPINRLLCVSCKVNVLIAKFSLRFGNKCTAFGELCFDTLQMFTLHLTNYHFMLVRCTDRCSQTFKCAVVSLINTTPWVEPCMKRLCCASSSVILTVKSIRLLCTLGYGGCCAVVDDWFFQKKAHKLGLIYWCRQNKITLKTLDFTSVVIASALTFVYQ